MISFYKDRDFYIVIDRKIDREMRRGSIEICSDERCSAECEKGSLKFHGRTTRGKK